MELQPNLKGNCIPLEKIGVLTYSSTKIINSTTKNSKHTDDEVDDFHLTLPEHDYILGNVALTELVEEIVEYIPGYIAMSISCKLKCP